MLQDYHTLHQTYISEIYYSDRFLRQEHKKMFATAKAVITALVMKIVSENKGMYPHPNGEDYRGPAVLRELKKTNTPAELQKFFDDYGIGYYFEDDNEKPI